MNAFDESALWLKSKVYLDRGLAARDGDDFGSFHLWAALALELLGKAALAKVHPALVADPSHFESLLVACGRPVSDSTRTIGAKTTYQRIRALSKEFDERSEKFCMLMANRRNADIHSGACPTEGLEARAWVPEFWRIATLLNRLAGHDLVTWVGEGEANRVQELLADTSLILAKAVESRVARCAAEFESRYPRGSQNRTVLEAAVTQSFVPPGPPSLTSADRYIRLSCPACDCDGWLFGMEIESHREPVEYDPEDGAAWQTESVTYASESFMCMACNLRLEGRIELHAAGVIDEFVESRDVEPDYEPDYGND